MKRLVIALIFLPTVCFAQGWQIGNPVGTPRALPTPGTAMNRANVDTFGNQLVTSVDSSSGARQSIIPVSNATGLNGLIASNNAYMNIAQDVIEAASTATVLNLTGHVARVGDVILAISGTAANLGVGVPVCSVTANTVTLCNALPATPSTDTVAIKRPSLVTAGGSNNSWYTEDTAPPLMAVRRDTLVTTGNVNGGYTPLTASSQGILRVSVINNAQIDGGGLLKTEDSVAANGDALVGVAAVNEAAITASAPTGDYGTLKGDTGGRLISAMAPAGETFQSCGTATATTADVAIKAAVVSNRHYITGFTCKNTAAATATPIDFKDGTTIIAVGAVAQTTAASAGSYVATFNPPLRGTANTAINFATNVSTTSVTCCANGYISTI